MSTSETHSVAAANGGRVWLLCSWEAARSWRPSASWPCESLQGHCRVTTGSLLPQCRHPAHSSLQHTTAALCDVTSFTWRASQTRSKLPQSSSSIGPSAHCWRLGVADSMCSCGPQVSGPGDARVDWAKHNQGDRRRARLLRPLLRCGQAFVVPANRLLLTIVRACVMKCASVSVRAASLICSTTALGRAAMLTWHLHAARCRPRLHPADGALRMTHMLHRTSAVT